MIDYISRALRREAVRSKFSLVKDKQDVAPTTGGKR
jgi:hypothetical protein